MTKSSFAEVQAVVKTVCDRGDRSMWSVLWALSQAVVEQADTVSLGDVLNGCL